MYHVRMTPYEGDDDYIFVSYAHKDSDFVLPIIDNLHDMGYRLWFDEGIEASAEWPEYIEERMSGCTAVLAFVTDNFVDRPNCRKEITYSLNKEKPILYVTPEPVELKRGLDLQLADQQCIDMSKMPMQRFYQKLTEAGVMESCRWKAADGTEIKTKRWKRRKKKKENKWTTGRVIKTILLSLIIFIALCFIIDGLGNSDNAAKYQPTETSHSWEADSGGALYCKTCGVQTGKLESGQKTLEGSWPDDKIKLNGSDSSYFVPVSIVTGCRELTLNIEVTTVEGDPYGKYLLYGRNTAGDWKIIDGFELTSDAENKTVSYRFELSDPIVFTGLAVGIEQHDSSFYNIEYIITFTDVIIEQ